MLKFDQWIHPDPYGHQRTSDSLHLRCLFVHDGLRMCGNKELMQGYVGLCDTPRRLSLDVSPSAPFISK